MSSSWFPVRAFVAGCLVGVLALSIYDNRIPLPSAQILTRLFETPAALESIRQCNLDDTIAQRTVTLNGNNSEGSGLLLDGRYLLTAAHVVDNQRHLDVRGSLNDTIQASGIEIIGINHKQDLALILIDRDFNLPPLAVSPTTLVDTHTFAYSHMQDNYLQATLGHLEDGEKFMQGFPEKVIPGDSGTVLLNCAGQISGNVVSFYFECLDENGFPIEDIDYDERYCTYINGANVTATAINIFLKKNWPNYNDAPIHSVKLPRTSRSTGSN